MARATDPKARGDAVPVISPAGATTFRLSRQHLLDRLPSSDVSRALLGMGGSQAQLLSAAWLSIAARVCDLDRERLPAALDADRTLVRAWCMRRTLFVVPAAELAVFARGTTRCAEKEVRWLRNRGVPADTADRILDRTLATLDEPVTRTEIGQRLRDRFGAKLSARRGGGWGSARAVPWVTLEGVELPVPYLLRMVGARGVVCSGPSRGAEATYVRADAWIPGWRDQPRQEAEEALLIRYLRSFAPATPHDFATWSGLRLGDAREIFSAIERRTVPVRFGEREARILRSDRANFRSGAVHERNVRLLPHFDSYLLGHASHRTLVSETRHHHVYRPAGWVSPVLLVGGSIAGVWSHDRDGARLRVRVRPFRDLSSAERRATQEEAELLGRFLGATSAATRFVS